MKRREFITFVGAATVAPFSARAQQLVPVVGFLYAGSPEPNGKRVAAFRKGLSDAGYVEGRNVAIEFRWAEKEEQLLELAADLVRQRVAVIATPVSTQATLAAIAATATTPVVFAVGGDPVALGLVASLNRPGGNITGISILNVELMPKRLGLLREMAPQSTRFGVLVNPQTAFTPAVEEPAGRCASARAAGRGFSRQHGWRDRSELRRHLATARRRIAARSRRIFN
jgi:putative ABC transport system substrate-binding protein